MNPSKKVFFTIRIPHPSFLTLLSPVRGFLYWCTVCLCGCGAVSDLVSTKKSPQMVLDLSSISVEDPRTSLVRSLHIESQLVGGATDYSSSAPCEGLRSGQRWSVPEVLPDLPEEQATQTRHWRVKAQDEDHRDLYSGTAESHNLDAPIVVTLRPQE